MGPGFGPAGGVQQQMVTVPLSEWQALQLQLRGTEMRQRELVDALASLSASSTRTISELQVGAVTHPEAPKQPANCRWGLQQAPSFPPLRTPS